MQPPLFPTMPPGAQPAASVPPTAPSCPVAGLLPPSEYVDTPQAWQTALAAFLRSLEAKNRSPLTIRAYQTDLFQFLAWLEHNSYAPEPAKVERADITEYLASLGQQKRTGVTRARKLAAIRSFFAFLEDQEVILASPARKLIPPEREQHQPRVLTEAEYKRLLDVVKYEPRDAAIIELLLQTGMRLSELARLTLQDIKLPAKISRDPGNVGSVRIFGKGRKGRTVTLNWKACKAIKAYLAIRPQVEADRLLISKFRAPMSPRAIQNAVTKYLKEANIVGASVHSLRHTFGTHMVKKGVKLDVVRQALGHASLKTTSIYVQLAREVMDRELQEHAL
jgi:site-specific recombinase XerD